MDKQETTNSLAGSLEYLFEHLHRSIDRNTWGHSNKSKDSRCQSPSNEPVLPHFSHMPEPPASGPTLDVNGKVIVYHKQGQGLNRQFLQKMKMFSKSKSLNYKGKYISQKCRQQMLSQNKPIAVTKIENSN